MNSNKLRKLFIDYFKEHGHTEVSSCPLIPPNDPTLLFTNAGMVQFKDVFLGRESKNYTRAVSSQRCVRAGGKHNDLENVGYTARHHTFFEMLGNFSFGDYFKRDAIQYAWEFLTTVLEIPQEKLWVTVYKDDDEAADIWLNELKVDPKRFSRCGEKDNFWSMGETGPCGPCTEIFYDHGPAIEGGPPGTPEQEGDRYVEIWNLVFMQYDRMPEGELKKLPKPSVDTGMGLERLSAVMQSVHDNYDTDLFQPLIRFTAKLAGIEDIHQKSLRVIADHIRSSSFLILDGVVPSNEGRGYVLRRIIRRAIRHGHQLGITDTFFHKLVQPLAEQMQSAYPELFISKQRIERVLLREEEQFARTLDQGLKILEQEISVLTSNVIPGDVVFRLYDTYGFPIDLTADIAREHDLIVDHVGFEQAMEKQRQSSQAASQFVGDYHDQVDVEGETEFTGYEHLGHQAKVIGLIRNGQSVQSLSEPGEGAVILDKTPFYAESGGQVGDKGLLIFEQGRFNVENTYKQGNLHIHLGDLRAGTIKVGDLLTADVDRRERQATVLNHSATHLLHAALRKILGDHVIQKGSLVESARLRFDFSHPEPLTQEELTTIEELVNQKIRENIIGEIHLMSSDDAVKQGALALFGEKYDDQVRVLTFGDFSKELCGGTHVQSTGEIGFFKIISETGIAAGIRRIEAITGEAAWQYVQDLEQRLAKTAKILNTDSYKINERVEQLLLANRTYEKELEQLKNKLSSQTSDELMEQVEDIQGIKFLAVKIPAADPKTLRNMLDQLKQKLKSGIIILASVSDTKINLIAGVTKDHLKQFPANELVSSVAQEVGGRGGGRPDMAQAGGNEPEHVDKALSQARKWVEDKLN